MSDARPPSETELSELIASIDVRAPAELHRRVQAMADEASARRSPLRRNPLALRAGAMALAALAVGLLLALGSSGGASRLTVQKTAGFALAGATRAAPGEDPAARSQLEANVEGITFPYWDERFGWRSSGSRLDHADGRTITTVFYSDAAGRTVGYAIVAGSPAPSPGSGALHWVGRTRYYLTSVDGAGVVSWIRSGHLCVVSGRGVPAATLLALASWQERGSLS